MSNDEEVVRVGSTKFGHQTLVVFRSKKHGLFGIEEDVVNSRSVQLVDPFTIKAFLPTIPSPNSHPKTWWCCGRELDWDDACAVCNTTTED